MAENVKNFNLGNFIKLEHVNKAYELLGEQLKQTTFTFKTIDFQIYRREDYINNFDIQTYYQNYIKKDQLYNYPNLFYISDYSIPKGAYGVRKFNYTSFHLLILYYALGFYFFELVNDSLPRIETFKKDLKNIQTFYGGSLNYHFPDKSQIYYQNDYADFNNGIKKAIKNGLSKEKKVMIVKLDIQDFYNTIDTILLLEIIGKYSLPSMKKKLHFDNTTKEAILDLFSILNRGGSGLPLSAQNIISNFISYLFLFELDNFIQQQSYYIQDSFNYFRYIDDFFLIIERDNEITFEELGNEIFDISTNISDFLSRNLKLQINHLKSQHWVVENKQDYDQFLIDEKFISFVDIVKRSGVTPHQKIDDVCQIINSLKKTFKETGEIYIKNDQDVTLKEVFTPSIRKFVKSNQASQSLNDAFKNWNPILTLNSVKALMFLIGNSSTGYDLIKQYFSVELPKKMDKTQNIYLLEKFLNIDSYDGSLNDAILSIDKPNSLYFNLLKRMIRGKADDNKQYFPISNQLLVDNDSLMQQIKMLIIAKGECKFNLAFNHMLNSFHILCFILDKNKKESSLKNYDQLKIVTFLTERFASIEEINFVMSFFDRRNKNNISHPGDSLLENWVVNEKEFDWYYQNLDSLIRRKLS